jgi:hypothetical protein
LSTCWIHSVPPPPLCEKQQQQHQHQPGSPTLVFPSLSPPEDWILAASRLFLLESTVCTAIWDEISSRLFSYHTLSWLASIRLATSLICRSSSLDIHYITLLLCPILAVCIKGPKNACYLPHSKMRRPTSGWIGQYLIKKRPRRRACC